MLPPLVHDRVSTYLRGLDAAVPGRAVGVYVVGSTALGAFVADRSDVDLFVVVDRALADHELDALRRHHRRTYWPSAASALARGRYPLVCNASFLRRDDLRRPPADGRPIASHTSYRFAVGEAFDANPVGYLTLARHGVAVRGAEPAELDVHHDPVELHRWNLANLDGYWRRWAATIRRRSVARVRARAAVQYGAPWAVLGAPRSHHTCATGDVSSKAEAGRYALDTFGPRWHPLIRASLEAWEDGRRSFRWMPADHLDDAAAFVEEVADSARELPVPSDRPSPGVSPRA